ncbi:hypothetical protein HC891_02715 [Candidatus Gracilibacteria bacterium]|nr:hypothetical protein [Candidatus Gracilibacteria bacterium]
MKSMLAIDTMRSEVLFIDRSQQNDAFRAVHQEALKLLRASPSFDLRILTSFSQVRRMLEEAQEHQFRVIVLWLNAERRAEWQTLFSLLEDVTKAVGVIVVFGFEDEAQDIAREVMIRDGYAFACPFNPAVLSAYIEANDLYLQSIAHLAMIEDRFWAEGHDIAAIKRIIFAELKQNHSWATIVRRLTGSIRATVSATYWPLTITQSLTDVCNEISPKTRGGPASARKAWSSSAIYRGCVLTPTRGAARGG